MEVFNSDHGSNILGCGNLCTAGSQIFKTNEFTWFSEVNYFEWKINWNKFRNSSIVYLHSTSEQMVVT
jgi:hypothetical protein